MTQPGRLSAHACLQDNCGSALGMFVGCLFNEVNMAMTMSPMFLLPLAIMSGFFVNTSSV